MVPAALLKAITHCFGGRLYTVEFERISFLLLSSVWTLHREISLSRLSSGQQLSLENTSPSALTTSDPFLLLFAYSQSQNADCWNYSLYFSANLVGD